MSNRDRREEPSNNMSGTVDQVAPVPGRGRREENDVSGL